MFYMLWFYKHRYRMLSKHQTKEIVNCVVLVSYVKRTPNWTNMYLPQPIVNIDLPKAFDTVNHYFLLTKLNSLCFEYVISLFSKQTPGSQLFFRSSSLCIKTANNRGNILMCKDRHTLTHTYTSSINGLQIV